MVLCDEHYITIFKCWFQTCIKQLGCALVIKLAHKVKLDLFTTSHNKQSP